MLFELVILLMIVIKERNNYRCRDSDAEIRMLRGQMPEVSGRARHSCPRDRFGGQGTARPTCAACSEWRYRGGMSTAASRFGERTGAGAGDRAPLAITNSRRMEIVKSV